VIKKGRLRWLGYVEHKIDENWVKHCTTLKDYGTGWSGRLKKYWWDCVENDMENYGLSIERGCTV